MSETRPPSPEAIALMRAWPYDDWFTEQQLAEALRRRGHEVIQSETGAYRYFGRDLVALLREGRRRSWLLRDRRTPEFMYKRTPTGFQAGAAR